MYSTQNKSSPLLQCIQVHHEFLKNDTIQDSGNILWTLISCVGREIQETPKDTSLGRRSLLGNSKRSVTFEIPQSIMW